METKICNRCGDEKSIDEFYKDSRMRDGHLGHCIKCHRAGCKRRYYADHKASVQYHRQYRKRPAWKDQHREHMRTDRVNNELQNKARDAVAYALRCGKLTKGPCEVCNGTENVHAHHDDYTKPLEVRWRCDEHHYAGHGRMMEQI